MRTLSEILDAAKGNQPTTPEELLYALLAMSALHHFDHMDVIREREHERGPAVTRLKAEESFRRFKTALSVDPQSYVGWNNDPKNPGYRSRVALAHRVLERVVKKAEAE